MSKKRPTAVFFDRDGTINIDYSYVYDPEQVSLITGVAASIASLKHARFLVVIITNQSCVARGYATLEAVDATNRRVEELLLQEDPAASIDLTLVATDHPDFPTHRRKPGPGMILEAAQHFNIDLAESWVIGDKKGDVEAGLAAGIPASHCILVAKNSEPRTDEEDAKSRRTPFFASTVEAVQHILKASSTEAVRNLRGN